jgi:predicted peptidase
MHLMRTFPFTPLNLKLFHLLTTTTTTTTTTRRSISALVNNGIQARGGYVAMMLQARPLFVSHVAEYEGSESQADDYAEGDA